MKQIYIFTLIICSTFKISELKAQTIWTGPDLTYTKASNADWTLTSNQDMITSNVILTRQSKMPLYNYNHWQSAYGVDAVPGDLCKDFHNTECANNPSLQTFTPQGGTNGLKWAILDSTGSTTNWLGFSFYGTLGNSNNFYSFRNVSSMLTKLENGESVTSVDDNFTLNGDSSATYNQMSSFLGKKLGVWIEAEDIYFTLTFNTWGSGGSGGAISYTRSTNQTLSTNGFELENSFKLFPNPSSELIHISDLKRNENYRIYNILGAEIKNGIVSDNDQIDIRNFTKGVYFLKFDNGNTIKFIKE